jgi:hypothetical protein
MRAPGLAAFTLLAGCQGQPEDKGAAQAAAATPSATPDVPSALADKMAAQDRIRAAACKADETPIFACKLAGGKRVAVCGAGEWTGHYRFGSDTPELELAGGKYANVMYSGGGEAQIAFANGNTRYIVFSRIVRTSFGDDGNAPAISDGVVVERGGKFLDIKLCDDPDLLPVDVNAANAIWEDERELFTEETIRADPPGNE